MTNKPSRSMRPRSSRRLGFILTNRIALSASLIFLVVLPAKLKGQTLDDSKFPYSAIVLNQDAKVQSGPGKSHYSTQILQRGETVEVYREDPGGWCAIRPTMDSFSLVPESNLELVEPGIGRITKEGTQAWVGTLLGAVDSPLWQVKLKKGELVTVKGQASWPAADGQSAVWYQIAPPSGEFRWIRISDLSLPSASSQLNASIRHDLPMPERDPNTAAIPTHDQHQRLLDDVVDSTMPRDNIQLTGMQSDSAFKTNDTVEINHGWRQAKRPVPKTSNRAPGDWDHSDSLNRFANADMSNREFANRLNNSETGTAGTTTFGNRIIPAQINILEERLTNEMLRDPSEWRLASLESAATSLLANSADSNERQLAQRILQKITSCKTIQAGYRTHSPIRHLGSTKQPIGTGVLASGELSAEVASTFDAHGWLNELKQGGGASQSTYVLQNSTGKITHHVQASPGLNLHRYLKSRIGIAGTRGFHNRLNLDHVTAERVVVLEKPR